MCAVERRSLDADAVQRRLDDGVLLGMNCPAQLVVGAGGNVLAGTAHNVAVVKACRSAVVARGKDALVLYKECISQIDEKNVSSYLLLKTLCREGIC